MTKNTENRAMEERQSKGRRARIGGKIITKGSCKGEDRQITREEKNEEWEEGLNQKIETHS